MPTELVQIFKALADETRFRLLNLLLVHDLCVGALARHMGISEAAVSQHLKSLREAGLVRGEKRGYWTHYTVEKGRLRELAGGLMGLTDLQLRPKETCLKNSDQPRNDHKEEVTMCDCKCQQPEKLKGKPEECTLEQIKECHGDQEHPCCDVEKDPKE
ncbi:MAG: winged helix-turn-helix transcriptional regulator [Deltaproteobacteria bacterium]|nr:winged helix-turn-helix transcriptional regulator [Deltaproteobacteria bacterium]